MQFWAPACSPPWWLVRSCKVHFYCSNKVIVYPKMFHELILSYHHRKFWRKCFFRVNQKMWKFWVHFSWGTTSARPYYTLSIYFVIPRMGHVKCCTEKRLNSDGKAWVVLCSLRKGLGRSPEIWGNPPVSTRTPSVSQICTYARRQILYRIFLLFAFVYGGEGLWGRLLCNVNRISIQLDC